MIAWLARELVFYQYWKKKINENQYGDGLLGYITAIAIEDITECNLKEDKDLQWATVSEFGDSWKKFKRQQKKK